MKLPEEIDIATIVQFEPNYELAFEDSQPPSWELEESLVVQDAINDDYITLEKRYNDYARARNAVFDAPAGSKSYDRAENALALAQTALYYTGLVSENEPPKERLAGRQLLTRVAFSQIVDRLCNELPDVHTFDDTSHVDFARITYEADMPYMYPDYQEDEDF